MLLVNDPGDRGHICWLLLLAGVPSLLLGALRSLWLPLNKNLWTLSFVLRCTGWATLALLAFHGLIDRRGWPAFGRRFGVNAIAAYTGSELMRTSRMAGAPPVRDGSGVEHAKEHSRTGGAPTAGRAVP